MPAPTVLVVYGTRPEAIKLAPVIAALGEHPDLRPTVVTTGQHRSMLDQVNEVFGIVPDRDIDIFEPGQSLVDITTRGLAGVSACVRELAPDAVLVQGDTTTTFTGALAAFYEQVPVIHLEAGLRTSHRYAPFPEEINRRLTTQVASLHLAPTAGNRDNLLAEGVPPETVAVTGNTVIDALLTVADQRRPYADERLERLAAERHQIVLVTTHRRESWGEPMRQAMRGVAEAVAAHPGCAVVVPMHRNPLVREVVEAELAGLPDVVLTEPLPYAEFARLLSDATVVVTDSGGVQEEAPSLGTPVLVLRDTTERPEAVDAGTVRLVGTDRERIAAGLSELLAGGAAYARMATAVNPYGDGKAADRCVAAIGQLLGASAGAGARACGRLPDFAG